MIDPIESLVDDFPAFPGTFSAEDVASWLDRLISDLLAEIKASDVWALIATASTADEVVREVLKEIYLEIGMYQADALEGAVKSIAQFPRQMPVVLWDEMLHHQSEEFDHGEMALRDYVALGGDLQFARGRMQSPSAFAVAAVWNYFSVKRDPWMYLGAVYLFDALTPLITQQAAQLLSGRTITHGGVEFITHHATADIEHARQIRALIVEVLGLYPERAASVVYGFEYFRHVYPLPCWNAAMARALHRTNSMPIAAE